MNKQEVRTDTLPVPALTVQPIVVVRFRPDVMLAAAADGRTEDGGVGAHKIYRGAGVQLAICRGRGGGKEGWKRKKERKRGRKGGRNEHRKERKGRKMIEERKEERRGEEERR